SRGISVRLSRAHLLRPGSEVVLQRLDGENPDVFCHATQLMHGADSLPVGQRVRFDLASNVRRAARLTPLNVTGCTSPRGVFSQGANPIISNATVSNILPVVRHS
ncbi:MAG: hypothetical protein WAN94_12945, partial [Pseudolabrys sp.]